MRRLLIVCNYFPPCAASGSYRMLGFVRHLQHFGWEVDVLSSADMPGEPVDAELARKVPPGTNVRRVPYPTGRHWKVPKALLNKVDLLDTHMVWVPAAVRAGLAMARSNPPSVILTSGPPHSVHLAGMRLQRRLQVPWVCDLRDPITFGLFWRWSLKSRLSRLSYEQVVFERADQVVLNTPGVAHIFKALYSQWRHKAMVVTNGYDPEDFDATPQASPPNGSIELLHAGELYLPRDPRPLLAAMAKLRQSGQLDPLLTLTFLGRCNINGFEPERHCRELGIDKLIRFELQVGSTQARARMSAASGLVMLDNAGRALGVPAKLYEYLGSQRPVFALAEPEGDSAWVLRESQVLHGIAKPDDVAGIAKALQDFTQALRRGQQARLRSEGDVFTRRAQAGVLARALDRLTT